MDEKSQEKSTAEKLGYPSDARLLIINADDFGMCHDENEATIEGLGTGIFTSSTILTTCPWFEEAATFARANPAADLGVHLTLNAEWPNYKWGPVLGASAVPSLADARGYLWSDVPQVYANARLDEAERELRAQIDRALAAGIDVTHIDSHMGPLHLRADYHEIYWRLARDYRLPIRMTPRRFMRKMGFDAILDGLDRDGILYPDNFVAHPARKVEDTARFWTDAIRALRSGVSELYAHPALARAELRGCANDPEQREADFRFFTSEAARRLVADEGIKLVGYRELREAMRRNNS
ncbi:MAG: polysaccharide deacetylase family protein [Candidatus Binataceae bacterium]